ncbi:MFS transporter [Salirhabdus sp. Marseille-P4669]|uniref:MFS transporter n=1 Tax=Salirhabdus sp. Marseille-P4669 TaxID=2042310 RepID=UPI000C7BA972|nr:MFS transporter [Salirhabdus sp. Marseille-P4669]
MGKQKWALFALASIPLLMTLANSMFIPVLPVIEDKIDISPFQSSMIITVYSVVAIPLIPLAGYLSDKFGRKKVIIPSLIITAIGGGVAAAAAWLMENPYMIILLGRFLQGVGASGAFPVVIPTVGDMFKDEEEVTHGLGIIETSNTFGKVLSPILGSVFAFIIWYAPFFAVPVLSLIATILIVFLVKPPQKKDKQETSFKQFLQTIKKVFQTNGKWLIAIFIIGGLIMYILFGFLFFLSEVLEDKYDIKGIYKGFVLAIPLLILCSASYLTGKKVGEHKVLMKWLILIGNSIAMVSLFFVKEEMTIFLLILLLSLTGLGIGVSLPCLDSLITEGVEKDVRGTITSLYSSMRFVGVAAGPPITAMMMKGYASYLFFVLSGLCLISVLLSFFFIKPDAVNANKSPLKKGTIS